MGKYFVADYTGGQFRFFSLSHDLALLSLLVIVLAIYFLRKSLRSPRIDQICRYTLASLLILQEISLNIWRVYTGAWTLQEALPLHLCGAAIIVSAIMLVTRKHSLYELSYFWGMSGAIQALLTPDIGIYSFPHYRYFQFFISHGLIILASLYMTFVGQYRPVFKSVWRTFLVTNLYMVIIAGFNYLTGSNYLFICQKPATGSLLDIMGPWPWYILALEFMAVVSFLVYYAPFAIERYFSRRKEGQSVKKLPVHSGFGQ